MNTIVTDSPAEAAALIRAGELVAFPTETVYGLGAAAFDARAVRKVFEAKGRPADNPLIAHVASVADISLLARDLGEPARALVAAFFPGPLTLVLPKQPAVPLVATAGLDTIGVRMPRHPVAREFLRACGTPVVAPSANLSGRPSPTRWETVVDDLGGRIAAVLKGGPSEVGLESTVVDCTGEQPLVLRLGALALEELREVVPETRLATSRDESGAPRSPGTKYRHYAPRARVAIVALPADAPAGPRVAYIGSRMPPHRDEFGLVRVVGSVDEYARELFAFFRECDTSGIDLICCEAVDPSGIGAAVMDRISRAAHAAEP
jgi:L-threonylcarbamoyladenylate synthase